MNTDPVISEDLEVSAPSVILPSPVTDTGTPRTRRNDWPARLKEYAQALRRWQSRVPEIQGLWQCLRRCKTGVRMRRRPQFNHMFLPTFGHRELGLAIYIVPPSAGGNKGVYEHQRRFMEAQGVTVLTFTRSELRRDLPAVVACIQQEVDAKLAPAK